MQNSREDPVTVVADDPDELWQDLLETLRPEGAVREVGPGRLEVASDETTVTVLVTPDQWVEVVAAYVDDDLGMYVAELFGSRDDDEGFVVFWDGRLTGSTREELPPVRGRASERTVARLRAEHGDGQLHWRA
ncbi:hypothetical protein SAMN04488570_1135 [Nocardioides scoriae]|uniref:Immunity protein Imm1 n=2 Tax=Nocardioides scoriae TaxID=642780 RepID=A0A1H1PGC7_9ACTN|nr:hypothetical protein SAMN04488570_1135 [Nocardioides scoriae]